MNNDFKDITDKLGEPKWYDSLGYPRYCKFTPQAEHNIYADFVALVLISCQSCGKKMKVAISLNRMDVYERVIHEEYYSNDNIISSAKKMNTQKEKIAELKKLLEEKKEVPYRVLLKKFLPNKKSENYFRYGDPPSHDNKAEFCHVGGTQTSEVVRVMQFWQKDKHRNWVRNKKHEIKYPTTLY